MVIVIQNLQISMPTSSAVSGQLYICTKNLKYNRQLVQTKDKSEIGSKIKEKNKVTNKVMYYSSTKNNTILNMVDR